MIKKIKLFSEIAREIILISRDRDGESDARFRDVLSFYETRKPFLSDQSDTSCATFHAVQSILIKYSRLIRSIITENRCFSMLVSLSSFFSFLFFSFSLFQRSIFFYNEVLTSVEHECCIRRGRETFNRVETNVRQFPSVT